MSLPASCVLECVDDSAVRGCRVHFSVLLGRGRRATRLGGHRAHLRKLGFAGQLVDDQLSRRIALHEGIVERTAASSVENPFAAIRRTHLLRSLEAEQPGDGQRGRVVGWLGKRSVDPDGDDEDDEDEQPRLSVRFS